VEHNEAYRSAELAELYDAVYADPGDTPFWLQMADEGQSGPILELGCGTGRLSIPLARGGHDVTGIDLAEHMLERGRAKLLVEPPEVRDRVKLFTGDMTAFDLDRRFAQIYCAFGTFHHLDTVEQQLACLTDCRRHLVEHGRLVIDLINPDPAPPVAVAGEPAQGEEAEPGNSRADDSERVVADSPDTTMSVGIMPWTEGRQIRSWATVVGTQRALQRNDVEVTYEVIEADGATRRVAETFPMRFVFRYELEHLLARCGFRVVALYGDYDRSTFADGSLGMIVVAEPIGE